MDLLDDGKDNEFFGGKRPMVRKYESKRSRRPMQLDEFDKKTFRLKDESFSSLEEEGSEDGISQLDKILDGSISKLS